MEHRPSTPYPLKITPFQLPMNSPSDSFVVWSAMKKKHQKLIASEILQRQIWLAGQEHEVQFYHQRQETGTKKPKKTMEIRIRCPFRKGSRHGVVFFLMIVDGPKLSLSKII